MVDHSGLPKSIINSVGQMDPYERVLPIPKDRRWLRRFDQFDFLREDHGIQATPLEVVTTLERHLGFIAQAGFLVIPRHTNYLVLSSSTKTQPVLYSLVDHIRPGAALSDEAASQKQKTDLIEGATSYIDWVESNNEPFGLFDLKPRQTRFGTAPSDVDEKTYLLDIEPAMHSIGFVNFEGHDAWEDQKRLIDNLANTSAQQV